MRFLLSRIKTFDQSRLAIRLFFISFFPMAIEGFSHFILVGRLGTNSFKMNHLRVRISSKEKKIFTLSQTGQTLRLLSHSQCDFVYNYNRRDFVFNSQTWRE